LRLSTCWFFAVRYNSLASTTAIFPFYFANLSAEVCIALCTLYGLMVLSSSTSSRGISNVILSLSNVKHLTRQLRDNGKDPPGGGPARRARRRGTTTRHGWKRSCSDSSLDPRHSQWRFELLMSRRLSNRMI
jgi:hypothetical protein